MRCLSESLTFLRVEIDIVNEQGSIADRQVQAGNAGARGVVAQAVSSGVELEIITNIVILESNQGQSETIVAAVEELERNEQFSCGNSGLHGGEGGSITDHVGITTGLASLVTEFIPDAEPVAIVFVDLRASNLELNRVNEGKTNTGTPSNEGTSGTRHIESGESDVEVHFGNEVTVTHNRAGHFTSKIGGTIESLFNGLDGKVSVTTVHYFEEGNLRITS
ncbi:MAG: hypothetical protein Faunusvirus27_6 [Faunusvirus sp.]|uniref:Uncharacterized protein n=1 Tax=Faunusvirus sp. TaxID=2487766 RepID=A0A3G4ZXH5_9VIRU|nr:MAG: hypothetical protein Faunusvirus27_6 [Faunusvirus sp.]